MIAWLIEWVPVAVFAAVVLVMVIAALSERQP